MPEKTGLQFIVTASRIADSEGSSLIYTCDNTLYFHLIKACAYQLLKPDP
jgi:hypothetical protein